MNTRQFHRIASAQARSGLSIAAFCRTRGIPVHSFHYWRRRSGSQPEATEFVEVKLQDSPASPPSVPPGSITLSVHGATFTLVEGFSPTSLRACLIVLKEVGAC